MKKEVVSLVSLFCMLLLFSVACFAQSNVILDFMTNSPAHVLEAYKEVAKRFEDETGITVRVTGYGKDFEALMKAKMATQDLPDMWMTHGWSVARYSEYLEPLNNQPWFDKINGAILPVISNDNGEIFVLPLDVDKSGVLFNENVLNEVGIDIDDLKTWDDFVQAFEKIKAIGKIPVGMGGKDPRNIAQFLDVMASQVLIKDPSNNFAEELLNGTFDWSNWDAMSELLLSLSENGYLNKDILTADGPTVNRQMALDQIGFMFVTNSAVQEMREYNPDVKVGFMPLPSIHPGTEPIFIGGERNAVGVWKNTKNKEEALKFLEFLAREENMSTIAKAQGQMAAFKDVSVDLGILTKYYEKYADVEIQPYFDRVYLPSGMWSTLQQVGAGLISGGLSVKDARLLMEQDYNRLR